MRFPADLRAFTRPACGTGAMMVALHPNGLPGVHFEAVRLAERRLSTHEFRDSHLPVFASRNDTSTTWKRTDRAFQVRVAVIEAAIIWLPVRRGTEGTERMGCGWRAHPAAVSRD
jgi:hypothetical protein